MSYSRQSQSVSRPLLITLVVVAVVGAIWFAFFRGNGGGEKAEGVPQVPPEVKAMPDAKPQPGEPSAVIPK